MPRFRNLFVVLLIAVGVAACKSSQNDAPSARAEALPAGGTVEDGPITLSGQPETRAMAFGFYEFVPEAIHSEDLPLSFAVSGLPAWADFDPDTGTISGIPDGTDVGLYSGISVAVTDGSLNVALPGFSIEVYIPPLTSTTVIWEAPTETLEGEALDGIAGFSIHYGTSPYRFPHAIELDQPLLNQHFIANIPAGRTYYFVLRARDIYQHVSPDSEVIEVAL